VLPSLMLRKETERSEECDCCANPHEFRIFHVCTTTVADGVVVIMRPRWLSVKESGKPLGRELTSLWFLSGDFLI
jgi:hypothetical protein